MGSNKLFDNTEIAFSLKSKSELKKYLIQGALFCKENSKYRNYTNLKIIYIQH